MCGKTSCAARNGLKHDQWILGYMKYIYLLEVGDFSNTHLALWRTKNAGWTLYMCFSALQKEADKVHVLFSRQRTSRSSYMGLWARDIKIHTVWVYVLSRLRTSKMERATVTINECVREICRR